MKENVNKPTITIQEFLYLLNSKTKRNVYYQLEPGIEVYRIKPHTKYIYIVDRPKLITNSKYNVVLIDNSPLPIALNRLKSAFHANIPFYYSSK